MNDGKSTPELTNEKQKKTNIQKDHGVFLSLFVERLFEWKFSTKRGSVSTPLRQHDFEILDNEIQFLQNFTHVVEVRGGATFSRCAQPLPQDSFVEDPKQSIKLVLPFLYWTYETEPTHWIYIFRTDHDRQNSALARSKARDNYHLSHNKKQKIDPELVAYKMRSASVSAFRVKTIMFVAIQRTQLVRMIGAKKRMLPDLAKLVVECLG